MTEIDGLNNLYREAGDHNRPVLLLQYGFPASSFMFCNLIERLSDQFHIFSPDCPGFGYSDAPSTETFTYTFDRLAVIVEKFTAKLGLDNYALYVGQIAEVAANLQIFISRRD